MLYWILRGGEISFYSILVPGFPFCPHLELGDHAGLRVVAGRVVVHQSLGQHLGVKSLEHVLVVDVLKHHHLGETLVGRD